MRKYIINPFPNLSTKLARLDSFISIEADTGLTEFHRRSETDEPSILKIGGRSDKIESSASREVDSTIMKTTKQEGLVTNPNIMLPSSFFTPIPPMVSALLAGPLKLIDNPELLIGMLAIVGLSKSEKSYTERYKETHNKVIDNQEIEDMLFS